MATTPPPPLRQYQLDAIAAIHAGESRYLAADAGLGKTRMAMEIARLRGAKRILYVCPASVKLAVREELKKWEKGWKYHLPQTPKDIGTFKTHDVLWTIINYDKLSRGGDFFTKLVESGPYDMLIIDEAHFCKSLAAKRTRVVFQQLAQISGFVLPMSATPAPNHVGELYAPLRYLAPELITKTNGQIMRQDEFEDRYCQVNMKYVGGPRPVRQISGSRNMEDLNRRLGKFFLKLKKKDHLKELPPMQYVLEHIGVHIDPAALPDVPEGLSDDELLAYLNGDHEHFASIVKMIGLAKAESAADYIQDFLLDNDKKVVIWARHHDVIDALRRRLQEAHIRSVKIDGRDDQRKRENAILSFLGVPEVRCFVGQIEASGTGLTLLSDLVKPEDVFFVESSFVPGNNYQAACRVHRIGASSRGVMVRTFVASGVGLDQRIQTILNRKINELNVIF